MHILRLRPSDRRRSESHDASHYGTTGVGSFLQNLTKALEIDMVRFPIGTGVKTAAMIESQTEVTAMFERQLLSLRELVRDLLQCTADYADMDLEEVYWHLCSAPR
jgi:hypothetical protein